MSDDKDSIKEQQNGVDGVKTSDPTESDPLTIEEKNKRQVFWDKTRQKLSDKSGLSNKGLYYVGGLLFALLVLVIIVIALGACWPRTPHHQRFPVCRNDACLRASAQIQEYLNRSVGQCEDVWNWACGNWLAKNKLPPGRSKWNQRQKIMQEEATRIRELISTLPLPLHTGTVEWKLKHFYEACVEVDNVNMDEARPLTTIISELGGWFILRDWNTWDFEYKKILKQLHVKYGVTPYFKISVVPNPRIPGNSSIAISPAGLGLPDRSYYYAPQNDTVIAAYKQLIRDVVIHLSAPKADAEKFGNDIFYYEQRIAEITPESNELLDPINTYNPIKLSELKLTATSLPLHDILTAMFPSANVDDDTEIIVTSPDYLLKVSEIISSTDHKNLNSYMIWMLVKEFLPYLSSRFTSANDAFYSELLGISQPYQRWEFCTNLVQKFMSVAVDTLLERANPIEEATKKVINSTFVTLKNVVKRRLNKYNSVPLLYSRLEKKLLNMKLQIGLPLDTHNDTILKSYYNKLFVLKANLFESYKNGILFLKKVEESRLMENRGADYIINYAVQKPFKIRYSQSTNTVIVPRAVLTTPNFENRYPKSIIYGRLGVDIANAIVSSVLPFASAWTSEGKLLTPFHQSINDSSRLIRHSRQCLTNFVANGKLAAITETNLTSLHSFIYLSSLNIANEGLHVSLETDTHVHQPSLEIYEDSALFYLSHIQNYCSISTKQQDFYDNLIRFQLSEKSLLKLAWSQHQSMSESLDCSAPTENICSDIF